MIIKSLNTNQTTFNQFDLLGTDEVALSKAFAFLLSYDKDCYFRFVKFLDIKIINTSNNFLFSTVEFEKYRKEGRTDIELKHSSKYHIIVECKIKKGKINKQRNQYLTAFDKDNQKKVLCFLTQERDSRKQIPRDVIVKNISWLDIIELYNNKYYLTKTIVSEFLKFITKNYKMRELKEIVIQDLGDKTEIERFKKYGIYRRYQTFGAPLYFAPYYTRKSGKIEGISYISKILGILSFKPSEAESFRYDIGTFSSDAVQIENWIAGMNLKGKYDTNKNKKIIHTYFFLDRPFKFNTALRKDGGIKKGRGKNWIAAQIPKNKSVTFIDFIKHIPELNNKLQAYKASNTNSK